MAWRGEVEDGTGWGGLVPSKAERLADEMQAALERDLQAVMRGALLSADGA